jgi:DnaJ like chaperone protein
MSIWTRIAEALSALTQGEGLAGVFDALRSPPERSVAFTIAVIALGAKMAKADGQVTRDEVAAFREIFHIPKAEEANAARLFNLARQDVAGFEDYAQRVARMFAGSPQILEDVLEGLFHIAMADGTYHPNEDAYLERVAELFGISEVHFRRLRCRFTNGQIPDPYEVLGVSHGESLEKIRKVWRGLVRETHPDAMVARGIPEEAVKLAQARLIAINHAWEQISQGQT